MKQLIVHNTLILKTYNEAIEFYSKKLNLEWIVNIY